MIPKSEAKAGMWLGFFCFSIVLALCIFASIFGLLDETEPNFTVVPFLLSNLILHLLLMPPIFLFLHGGTKKIYISKDQIVEKSFFVRRHIQIAELAEIVEDVYVAGRSKWRMVNLDYIILRAGKKRIKVSNQYSNYDRLKQRFLVSP